MLKIDETEIKEKNSYNYGRIYNIIKGLVDKANGYL